MDLCLKIEAIVLVRLSGSVRTMELRTRARDLAKR